MGMRMNQVMAPERERSHCQRAGPASRSSGTPELLVCTWSEGWDCLGCPEARERPPALLRRLRDSSAKISTAKPPRAGWMAALEIKGEESRAFSGGWRAAAQASSASRGRMSRQQEFRGAEGSPLLQNPRPKAS